MTESPLPDSVRYALDRRFLAAVLVAVALVVVGGYVTYDAHVEGGDTVAGELTTGTWTVGGEFDHAATVERGTEVFAPGDRLENRPLYFTTVAPRLNGTYTLTHDNTDGESATASIELSLVVQSVEEIDQVEVTHWRTSESLATLEAVEIPDGDEESATVGVNVSAVIERIQSVQADLGSDQGDAEALIVADTTVEGSVAGETFTDTRTDRIEIDPGAAVYRVSTDVQDRERYEVTGRVTRTVEPPVLLLYGGPLLLLVGVLGATGLGVARWRDWLAVTERERACREFRTDRDDFDDWISAAGIPETGDRTVVRAETLEDLVDIAIDSDRRVLEEEDRYAVLVGDVMYTYTAPKPADPLEEPDDGSEGSGADGTVEE